MSARLNVLLVQSPAATSLQSRLQESLVMRMIGAPGLDLAIVTSIDPEHASDTEQLLLASLSGDVAVIDWRDPETIVDSLARCGIAGARAPHPLDPTWSSPPPGQRKLYIVDLRNGDSADRIEEGLRQLLNERRVVAVPLLGPTASVTPSNRQAAVAAAPATETKPTDRTISSAALPHTDVPRNESPRKAHRPFTELDLDDWVEGVNGSDW